MNKLKKRFLAGLLSLVMAFSLLPVPALAGEAEEEPDAGIETGAFAEATDPVEPEDFAEPTEEGLPYCLLVTHSLNVEGETYGMTEMLPLAEEDFQDGVYDFRQNALDREGMETVKGSWLDMEAGELTEGWTLEKTAFTMGGDPEDGSAYYAAQLLIEYAVASGYRAVVSDIPSQPGEYDAMALTSFSGGSLGDITFTPADVMRVTIQFQYSKTGSLAGTAAYDTAVLEVPVTKTGDRFNQVECEWDLSGYVNPNFRMLLNPYPLNTFLVDANTAHRFTSMDVEELDDGLVKETLNSGAFNIKTPAEVYQNGKNAFEGYTPIYDLAWDVAREVPQPTLDELKTHIQSGAHTGVEESKLPGLLYDDSIEAANISYSAKITSDTAHPGAAAVGDHAKLQVTISAEQVEKIMSGDLEAPEITVYYRRNATSYTVKHWVPDNLWSADFGPAPTAPEQITTVNNIRYYLAETDETLQGRVGALTNAQASGEDKFLSLGTQPIVQEVILQRNTANDPGTVVDVYYKLADAYRVIFHTDYAYIQRQTVAIDGELKLVNGNTLQVNGTGNTPYSDPVRAGYRFGGWMLKLKSGVTSFGGVNGESLEGQSGLFIPVDLTGGLTLTNDLLENVEITQAEGEDGVRAVFLYAKWVKDGTNVRVVLWTEDLNGTTDVTTNGTQPTSPDPTYSNVGSFTFTCTTGAPLLDTNGAVSNTVMVDSVGLSTKVTQEFEKFMGTETYLGADKNGDTATTRSVKIADFYTRDHATVSSSGRAGDNTVAADGSTVLYVYYKRNVYTLEFEYYNISGNGTRQIANITNDYANTGGNSATSGLVNSWATVRNNGDLPQNRNVTLKAKYGADLREVWPQFSGSVSTTEGGPYRFVSWTTTKGPYNEIAKGLGLGSSKGEPTIMGLYGSMSWQVIADAKNTNTTHKLYAYWYDKQTYYRYNHCFEIPDLEANALKALGTSENQADGFKKVLYNYGSGTDLTERNTLYLLPKNHEAFKGPGYQDLLAVNADGKEAENGAYYAVRIYTTTAGATKCYALGRQVSAVSSAKIAMQNPSARLHLTKVNGSWTDAEGTVFPSVADHTTQYAHSRGNANETNPSNPAYKLENNSEQNPYDLYFYYDRDRYTITYVAPLSKVGAGGATEYTLGTITLPYGAELTGAKYGFKLTYGDKNNDRKYPWTPDLNTVAVCPNRAETGTAVWNFNGWSLGPTGAQMQWAYDANGNLTDTEPFAIQGNMRLYAQWGSPQYQVRFDLNGGTGAAGAEQTQLIPANTSITTGGSIPRPVRRNFTFVGWYEVNGTNYPGGVFDPDKKETGKYNFDDPVTRNLTIRAEWSTEGTSQYRYRVWHLCATAPDGDGPHPTGEFPKYNASGTGTYYILKQEPAAGGQAYMLGDYMPGSTLLLNAEHLTGYTPLNTDVSRVLAAGTENDAPGAVTYDFYFYYSKNTTKTYSIEFVLQSNPIEVIKTVEGSADSAVLTPSKEMFEDLKNQGYKLVKQDGTDVTDYKELLSGGSLTGTTVNPDGTTKGTFYVLPVEYPIAYTVGKFYEAGNETSPDSALKAAAQAALDSLTAAAGTKPADAAGKNPTLYTVRDNFTVKNPVFIQDGSGNWWTFRNWTLGTGTAEKDAPTTAGAYEQLHIDNSVGNLTFNVNWTRVTADLTVGNQVTSAAAGVTLPDDEFHYTMTLPALPVGTTYDDVLVVKTDKAGGTERITAAGTVNFTLKNGETLSVTGLAGSYTVTESTNTTPSFDNTQRNYYTLDSVGVNGTTSQNTNTVNPTVGGGGTVSALFQNTYHATVRLDTDGNPGNGVDQSFQVTKYLTEGGNRRPFFGGYEYSFHVRPGAQSAVGVPGGTPLPDNAGGNVVLRSNRGDMSLSGGFGGIRFAQAGTYTYVLSENRPGGQGVPGVSYDNTMYRVTVEVKANGSDLEAAITKLETRDTPDTSSGATTGWTQKAAGANLDLSNSILFTNTYNTAEVTRTFESTKELTGRTLKDGEFTFTLTPAGSHAMTRADATRYHGFAAGSSDRRDMLAGLEYGPDNAQRMPSGVGPDGKVKNGSSGAITMGSITYTVQDMGGKAYGKVYKYTISEDIPEGAVDNQFQGVTYDASTKSIYVYVHLHDLAGQPVELGATNTLVYADVHGDRNSQFVNNVTTLPVDVELGGDPDPDAPNAVKAPILKNITGRSFTTGDEFTFNLSAENGAPLPQKDGQDCTQVVIRPTSGTSAPVSFGKLTVSVPGTYTYTLTEVRGNAPRMTYDTAPKTLTITVRDGGEGKLVADISTVTWTNTYTPVTGGGGGGGGGPRPSPKKPETPAKLDTSDHFAYILGKSDGLVHPEANITRAEVATVFYRLLTEDSRKALWTKENPYPDVPSTEWCNIAVSVMSKAGVIKGRVNGKFDPYANITRGEFAAIASRFLSEPYVGEDYYTDISGHWAREYINRAAAAGWVKDFERPFRPNDFITRAEVMSLVNAMIGRAPDKDHMHEDMVQWPDNMDTTKWYYEDVQEATNSHEYVRMEGRTEDWTKVLPVRNWNDIEKEWSDIYDAENPGDVTSRGDIAKK
ncbi:MAG: hypothetical protein HFG05_03080 [Oscillibacter sp.]|nr:hypothetical protein [Oscillibacter sp.]